MTDAAPSQRAAVATATPPDAEAPWFRGAAIYQIYPRSFADSNGDGIGDLPGITAHLDHVASLGVDGVWISPFYTSPMRDFGYDIADYCDVDPIFGTLADFDALVARAHALGLKVIIDQVYAHTSDRHAWFADSRAARTGPRADWYVWADAKRDGSPPNNWQSVFGGPAWTWDARRGQYYMHSFLKEQPQLNAHDPAVQDALLDVARFWLARGVDGFRLDALNHAMHDPALRNNPVSRRSDTPRSRPFDFQHRKYSQSHPGVVDFVERIRALCDAHGAVFTLAEVGGEEAAREMKAFTAGGTRLNSAYGFDFLYAPALTPAAVAAAMAGWSGRGSHRHGAQGWPSWAFENHDAPRAVSRWAAAATRGAFARMKIALLAGLRGNIMLYQGEELGLEQDEIPFEALRDPEAIANWPLTLGRDGVRTPMPWVDAPGGGFSDGVPWLPMSPGNRARAVAVQEGDADSLLALTRQVIRVRAGSAALRRGAWRLVLADAALLAARRGSGPGAVVCVYNFTAQAVAWPAGIAGSGRAILAVNGAVVGEVLPPFGALWIGG